MKIFIVARSRNARNTNAQGNGQTTTTEPPPQVVPDRVNMLFLNKNIAEHDVVLSFQYIFNFCSDFFFFFHLQPPNPPATSVPISGYERFSKCVFSLLD